MSPQWFPYIWFQCHITKKIDTFKFPGAQVRSWLFKPSTFTCRMKEIHHSREMTAEWWSLHKQSNQNQSFTSFQFSGFTYYLVCHGYIWSHNGEWLSEWRFLITDNSNEQLSISCQLLLYCQLVNESIQINFITIDLSNYSSHLVLTNSCNPCACLMYICQLLS